MCVCDQLTPSPFPHPHCHGPAVALFLALLCLSCFGLAEFSVLVVTWNADAPCQRPLRTFIIGAMVFTVSCTVLVSLHRQLCKVWNRWPEATRKTLSWVASILSHMWFGMGSFFVFFANHCVRHRPAPLSSLSSRATFHSPACV